MANEVIKHASTSLRRVAIFVGGGAPAEAAQPVLQVCASAEGWDATIVTPEKIRNGFLGSFQVIVVPGGSGSAQASSLGDDGRRQIIDFVKHGGGYLGICGGAFLCTSHYSWSLSILNAAVFSSPLQPGEAATEGLWYRGAPTRVLVDFTDAGRRLLGEDGSAQVLYHNGPILRPGCAQHIEQYQPLAMYRSEICRVEAQRGTMLNTPAIVSGAFGDGRVIAVGPHLEADREHDFRLVAALNWLHQ